jgi:hypothetical protein
MLLFRLWERDRELHAFSVRPLELRVGHYGHRTWWVWATIAGHFGICVNFSLFLHLATLEQKIPRKAQRLWVLALESRRLDDLWKASCDPFSSTWPSWLHYSDPVLGPSSMGGCWDSRRCLQACLCAPRSAPGHCWDKGQESQSTTRDPQLSSPAHQPSPRWHLCPPPRWHLCPPPGGPDALVQKPTPKPLLRIPRPFFDPSWLFPFAWKATDGGGQEPRFWSLTRHHRH